MHESSILKNNSVIRVRLFGGLGNQLFQYFAGLVVSKYHHAKLEVDSRWIQAKNFMKIPILEISNL